jgi:hypothetical protein
VRKRAGRDDESRDPGVWGINFEGISSMKDVRIERVMMEGGPGVAKLDADQMNNVQVLETGISGSRVIVRPPRSRSRLGVEKTSSLRTTSPSVPRPVFGSRPTGWSVSEHGEIVTKQPREAERISCFG